MQEQRPERIADFRFVELRAFEFGFVRLRDVRLWDHGLAKPPSFAEMPNHLPNFEGAVWQNCHLLLKCQTICQTLRARFGKTAVFCRNAKPFAKLRAARRTKPKNQEKVARGECRELNDKFHAEALHLLCSCRIRTPPTRHVHARMSPPCRCALRYPAGVNRLIFVKKTLIVARSSTFRGILLKFQCI